MAKPLFLKKVTLRNYKSISYCDVKLRPLTFLVGPNGSGKSNFLDGIRLVSDALNSTLDHALRERGTIKEVRRRSSGHPNRFSIRLDFELPNSSIGHYSFRVAEKKDGGGFEVQKEECKIIDIAKTVLESEYNVESGVVVSCSAKVPPPALSDRLYLVNASGLAEFRPVYDALSRMSFYNLNPKEIGAMQKPDAGTLLKRDGDNCASVYRKLPVRAREQINDYLAKIVPGVTGVEAKMLGSQETLEFLQAVKGAKHPWHFYASSMSDGTLRAFGVLLALFQAADRNGEAPPLVGIEEPEVALHPAATGVLLGSLRDASQWTQIMVTSHSPDLLNDESIETESLLAVTSEDGVTKIGNLDQAGRTALKDRLFTAGELLRQNQLAPDPNSASDIDDERQLKMFETGE